MRQLLYVSVSLIGDDVRALDRLMVQAQTNNALVGITGLLWTDGAYFAQVLEGEAVFVEELVHRMRRDPRHHSLEIVDDAHVEERQYGDWSMMRPANDELARTYEQRLLSRLDTLTDPLSAKFRTIIGSS